MKVAIVGLGDIAQKAHLPVLTQLENIELVLCTRNRNTLDKLSKQYRISHIYQDYRDLIKAKIDAVMIHSSTVSHPEIATFFLQHGIPTFVDKPLADNAATCEKLYEIAEKQQQPLYIGFNRRFIPLYNQYIPELQHSLNDAKLQSLRWEKNRHNQPGDIRTFIFDDFIHPLDSVNLNAKSNLQDMNINTQFNGNLLSRLDVQWQNGDMFLHASMNRMFGITKERISANYDNRSFEFDSFVSGKCWQDNQQSNLALADWTPMLTAKGFTGMINDWLVVAEKGKLATEIVQRNIASHQLCEQICQKLLLNRN